MKKIFLAASLACISLVKAQDPRFSFHGIPQDKQKHYACVLAISSMTYVTAVDQYRYRGDKDAVMKANVLAFGVGMGSAVLKETYDFALHKSRGTWNSTAIKDMKGDLFASLLGALTVTVVVDIF